MAILPFLNAGEAWRSGRFPVPWTEGRPAIHDHLASLAAGSDASGALPDAAEAPTSGEIRFIPGAFDNLFASTDGDASRLVRDIRRVLAWPSAGRVAALYRQLAGSRAIDGVDAVVEEFGRAPPADVGRFAAFFEWLALRAPDREAVKFAIAMLGLCRDKDRRGIFLTLGRHEEFAKYAAVAVTNSLPEQEHAPVLMTLAQGVTGWGRVDLVGRLAKVADAPVRRWLVREGFRNGVMDEYTAWTAATAGRLLDQLGEAGAGDDPALLDGAAGILLALVKGGPAEDMSDYDDGAEVACRWLDLVGARPPSLERIGAAEALRHFVQDEDRGSGWSAEARGTVTRLAEAYLADGGAVALVRAGLDGAPDDDFWQSWWVAPAVGLDRWPATFARQSSGRGRGLWWQLMQTDDPARIQQVVGLALAQLPLDAIATGPGTELGLGERWRDHSALDFVVQDLRRFPRMGWPLVAAALRSPVIRNRNMAVAALAAWGKQAWPPAALPALRQALREEPDADVRTPIAALLQPEP